MYFIQFAFMAGYVCLSLYFQSVNTPVPLFLTTASTWIAWGFLLWGGFGAVRIIVDCLQLRAKNQMTAENMRSGMLLAVLHFLPSFGMSGFIILEGFR